MSDTTRALVLAAIFGALLYLANGHEVESKEEALRAARAPVAGDLVDEAAARQ